jgi:exopolysaccharide production protein ExoY
MYRRMCDSLDTACSVYGSSSGGVHSFETGSLAPVQTIPPKIHNDLAVIGLNGNQANIRRRQEGRPSWLFLKLDIKRIFDIAGVFFLIVLMLPVFALLAIIVSASQGRPLLIRHRRIGRLGKSFECIKIRTMVVNASEVLQRHLELDRKARAEWNATRKLKNDPRVTKLGYVLRKYSLDEWPQLYNILLGDMSFVGPRPIVEDEIKFYGEHFEDYLKVRPGLTGVWQISGRNDTSYPFRVQLDTAYVRNWTFSRDLLIILKTVPAVVMSKGSY